MRTLLTTTLGLLLLASPALAQEASGSASGAGATQGGTGAPGGGVGVPGATTTGETATAIGTSSTSRQQALPTTGPGNGAGMTTVPAPSNQQ